MDKNRLITYSLLAYINNHESMHIQDLNDFFLPLVKRTISKMNEEGVTRGVIEDIKQRVDTIYSLDIPFPILKKIVKKIASTFNTEKEKLFETYQDGSFIIKKYVFAEYEDVVKAQETDVETLTDAYKRYLIANQLDPSKQVSIFEFLDANRCSLSSFFANKSAVESEMQFDVQARFVNSIRLIPQLYSILRKVYLGSIITSYLEVDYGEIKDQKIELLLDTNFLIHLLDLSSPESTHTCRKIIEICKRLGYRISVLDYTIEEAQALLNRKAEEFDSTFVAKQVNPENIYNACARLGLTKTDLQRLASHLGETLTDQFGVYVVPHTVEFKNKATRSVEFEILSKRKNNPDGAHHDATAIIYVREKRKKKAKSFYDANCWFVTDAKQEKNLLYKESEFLPETIKPEDLVNILWLTNPNVKANEVTEVGLTRLVSQAINDSLPNPRVLKEFDDNLEKYAKGKVAVEDCVRLATTVAGKTLVNLQHLNHTAKKSPARFIVDLNRQAKRVKEAELRKEKRTREWMLKIHATYAEKLRRQEVQLKQVHQKQLEATIQKERKQRERDVLNAELQRMKSELMTMKSHFGSLDSTKMKLTNSARRSVVSSAFLVATVTLVLCALIIMRIGWNLFEPVSFVLGLGMLLFDYVFYAITNKEINPATIWERTLQRRVQKIFKKSYFDLDAYERMCTEINTLEEAVQHYETTLLK